MGYGTIAYNFIVRSRYDSVKYPSPFPRSTTGLRPVPFPELSSEGQKNGSGKLTQLTRMTLVLDEESMGKHGHGMTTNNQSALLQYDLLSAQPFNDTSFSSVCLTMTELKPISVDIITLDAASAARTPFFLKRSLVNAAIANGAVFEICYSKAVSKDSTSDDHLRARRNIIAVTRDLLRVTNGRGIILSSGASDLLGVRGPYDVINLYVRCKFEGVWLIYNFSATVFGMNATAARDAISSTCRSLILRANTRSTFRGVVGSINVLPQAPLSTAPPASGKRKQNLEHTSTDSAKKPRMV